MREALARITARLQRLEDRDALNRLIVAYARACDQGNDPALLAPLFAESAWWECKGFGRYEGRRQVAAGLAGIAGEKIWWSLHYMISPAIDIAEDGASASMFWYLWEAATIPNDDSGQAEAHWIGATYDATAVRDGERWVFSAMELKLNLCSPFKHGWVEQRFPRGSRSAPYLLHLDPGRYHWCACGRSRSQPFCDGSHAGTRHRPQTFDLEQRRLVALCGCKYSRDKPWCDGAHLNLRLDDVAPAPDPASPL